MKMRNKCENLTKKKYFIKFRLKNNLIFMSFYYFKKTKIFK